MRLKRALSFVTALFMAFACVPSVSAAEAGKAAEEDKYAKIEYTDGENTITREADGYFYEMMTIKHPSAIITHTPSVTPGKNGTFSADLSFNEEVIALAGKRYDDDTDILGSNYCISYKYERDESDNGIQGVFKNNVSVCARAVLHDPDTVISFWEMSESAYAGAYFSYYAGTLELDGEKYIVERERQNSMTFFDIFHICSDETVESETKECTYHITDLVRAAKDFGITPGRLYEISVKADNVRSTGWVNVLENNIFEDSVSLLDKDGSLKVYADVNSDHLTSVEIDNYDFYAQSYYIGCGSCMTAYNNGLFTLDSVTPQEELEDSAFDFGSNFNVGRTVINKMKVRKGTNIKYCINNGLDGKYGIVFDLDIPELAKRNERYCYLDIVEKLSGMDADEFIKSYEIAYNHKQTELLSSEFIKSYTSQGHEYDLYKCSFRYWKFGPYYDQIRYFAIRKDDGKEDVFEGSVALYDHYSQIEELSDIGRDLDNVALNLHICEAEGRFDVKRFELDYNDRNAADIIKGDFNNDKRIDSMDVLSARAALIRKIDGADTEGCEYSDINGNETFDIGDILLLQSFVIGRIKEFPQP